MKIHLCTAGGYTVAPQGQHPMRQAIEHKIAPHLNILSTSKEAEANVIPECIPNELLEKGKFIGIPTSMIILWHGINRVFTACVSGR